MVRQDVERMFDGYRNLDVQPLLELAHPNVLLSEGGPESIRMKLEPVFENLNNANGRFERMEVLEKPEFFQTKYDDFAIVRTQSVLESSKGRVQMTGFIVGHKKQNEDEWRYLDATGGTSAGEGVVRFHLPNLPASLPLPESSLEPLSAASLND